MLISKNIRRYCTIKGMRPSDGRETVADMLQQLGRPVTCEEIWLTIRNGGNMISEAGVYLHLRWLYDHGFVGKSKGAGRQTSFFIRSR